ncbi:MAG: PA2169 family four-helix-bundle protein [Candidatus Pseudobacter hemicellulosilyticus]|uniref:PA2169 family four-helix-bundle protein n=1 Tax=Candidatus Pseudobacter hemicellulosilyticus TaxID=3121375 RepID=A0AAJ5WPP6_9BACT|nr:MAG: PA2169 family four-helix-bundle protein [Pseudobacter sp.]
MKYNEELIDVLNDLIQINNDRITGYEKAVEETKDIDDDLRSVFRRMADESRQHKAELVLEVQKRGANADVDSTTNSGKIYRAWMGLKATFTGKDRHAVLASCEFGEDAAQKAYQQALESDATMDADIRQLIVKQKSALKESHDLIKRYRDMEAVAK